MYICRTRGSCLRTILTGILVLMIIFNVIFITEDWNRSKSNHENIFKKEPVVNIVSARNRDTVRTNDVRTQIKNIEKIQPKTDKRNTLDQDEDTEKKKVVVKRRTCLISQVTGNRCKYSIN